MADLGAQYTDEELKKFEKKITTVYKQAEKDITAKMKDFNAKFKAKEAKYMADVKAGKIMQKDFDAWKAGQVFQGKQWQAKKDQIADVLYNSNTIATNILNGHVVDVFAENATFMNYTMEHNTGVNFGFGIYDSATVVNLLKNEPKLLKSIGKGKDTAWNKKKVNRQVTQGIIQGESLDKIANRLGNVLGSQNKNSMMTAARTAMTSAQNAGREESYKAAEQLGIELEKEWMATFDEHTRRTHRDLDGQRVPNKDPFEVDGFTIRYPGDPDAPTEMIINCRCTMVADIQEYPASYQRYDNIEGVPVSEMTYKDWYDANVKWAAKADESVMMLDESEADGLISLFADKKMSHMYNDMREIDTKTATAFYNELKSMGKPSEIWTQYLNGTLPKNFDTSKLNGILKQYAEKKGLEIPGSGKSDLVKLFADKKMSNVYNEMKALDKTAANKFYKELGNMGKPSEVWAQYLNGTLSKDQTVKIETYLSDYAKKAGLIKPEGIDIKGLVGDRKMSNVYNELKGKDTKVANEFYKELKSMGKPSEVWQKYVNGEIKNSKIDDILKSHFGEKPIIKPKPTVKPKPKSKPKPKPKAKREPVPKEKESPPASRDWIEKKILPGKYGASAKNAAAARKETIDTLMETPESYRKCYAHTTKKITFNDDNGRAYYRDSERSISVNFDKIKKRDYSLATLFHETGHAMDYEYMRLRQPDKYSWTFEDSDRTSQLPSFLEAIEKDLQHISKEIDNPGSAIAMYRERDIYDNDSKGVQDFFSALKPLNDKGPRKGKIPENLLGLRYNWCHSYKYYTRKKDPMVDAASELFANISGGHGDPEQMKYMKKYFPNAVKEFENIMTEMAKLID